MTMLVCLDQFQFCNPQNGGCTDETHHTGAWDQERRALELNDHQMAVLWRIEKIFIETFTFNPGIGTLGVTGKFHGSEPKETEENHPTPPTLLLSSGPLVANISLIVCNQFYSSTKPCSRACSPPRYPQTSGFERFGFGSRRRFPCCRISHSVSWTFQASTTPRALSQCSPSVAVTRATGKAEWQCTGQKVRCRGQAQNFNVAGLIVIVAMATTIVLVGLLLEPCVGVFRGIWKRRPRQLCQFARATDNLYWLLLLHAGLCGSGAYQWRYGSYDSVHGEEVLIIDDPVCFGPPVNDDNSWEPFYQLAPPSPASSA